jgi:hypothetical protein
MVSETGSLRLDFPRLATILPEQDASLTLGFLNLTTELKFLAHVPIGEPMLYSRGSCLCLQ